MDNLTSKFGGGGTRGRNGYEALDEILRRSE
jgi:hypothetical protein